MKESEKLDAMDARIRQAKGDSSPEKTVEEGEASKANRIGYDFLGAILGGTFLGWLVDKGLGTKPWGLIIMIFMGFAVGVVQVWRMVQKMDDKDKKTGS